MRLQDTHPHCFPLSFPCFSGSMGARVGGGNVDSS